MSAPVEMKMAVTFIALFVLSTISGKARALSVSGVAVHKVPLERSSADSPYCLAVSSAADLNNLGQGVNFLATQVWPSARVAATALSRYIDPLWVVCELGCGPGLPSLTAAKLGASRVIATDLDLFALQAVMEAASAQNLDNIETRQFDLTAQNEQLPPADLYILSDVFESGTVAIGAAHATMEALSSGSRVWVFAQTDRAQRDVYLDELVRICSTNDMWTSMDDFEPGKTLWLCDVDEGAVNYG